MTPIRGWPHHVGKILDLVRKHRPLRGVEVGTYCGASAIPIAQVMQAWEGTLTCVDPWEDRSILVECVGNLRAHGTAATTRLIVAPSVEAARAWPLDEPIDFLYIDGDHSYEAVRDDLQAWWPWLAKGAVLCGDDYDDPLSPGVARAWDEFGVRTGQTFHLHETPGTTPPGLKLVWGIKG